MSKQIRKVRKSIEDRKKSRGDQLHFDTEMPMHIHDVEEKHGFPPEISGYTVKRRETRPFFTGLILKAIFAGILFFLLQFSWTGNTSLLQSRKQ